MKGECCISGLEVLQIVFIVLKLCGVMNHPWWFILMPAWVGLLTGLIGIVIYAIITKKK